MHAVAVDVVPRALIALCTVLYVALDPTERHPAGALVLTALFSIVGDRSSIVGVGLASTDATKLARSIENLMMYNLFKSLGVETRTLHTIVSSHTTDRIG